MGIEEWWRAINVVLAAVGFVLLARGTWQIRGELAERGLYLSISHTFAIFSLGWATFENLLQGNELGFRVPLSTVAAFLCIFAFTKPHAYTRKDLRDGKQSRIPRA